ncbi:MAG: methyltransferase domain-containing protein [Deltaproteobacteria bacterium]|nr:methyltransferase domain-containing protein [Deltaproteobacteria bacterium]
MALQCPIGFDVPKLRAHVRDTYRTLAESPDAELHFHRGPRYAAELLQYDADELAALPELATARFAGVGNPLALAPIAQGATVLDHACGAGTDLLLAARRVGPEGRAIGIDMTAAMLACARGAADLAGLGARVTTELGVMEELPIDDESVDYVISNGVVNLSPDKERVFAEIARVLRPGGRLLLADVVVRRELRPEVREAPELWAACVGGALRTEELFALAASVGLGEARLGDRYACFRGTSAEARVSKDLDLGAVGFTATKTR